MKPWKVGQAGSKTAFRSNKRLIGQLMVTASFVEAFGRKNASRDNWFGRCAQGLPEVEQWLQAARFGEQTPTSCASLQFPEANANLTAEVLHENSFGKWPEWRLWHYKQVEVDTIRNGGFAIIAGGASV
jgi:hypothetical protein